MFEVKFTLVVVAIVVMGYFHNTIKREAAAWDAKGAVSSRAFKFGAAMLLVWCSVVIAGRLTGYLGALYSG